ncbi:hypothetical protein [Clostridium perfringens]|uniref:hypothetical protein n=1 Tax=Clostridium perfringens TaxID=1502 RepID=UPI002B21E059|nr:hypothetical protein [Clostridium perfringens]MEA5268697.1 hypothetical protein [Clostridium perfringens]MEA5380380.1 hypothetical protein [Clostridium perfringens]
MVNSIGIEVKKFAQEENFNVEYEGSSVRLMIEEGVNVQMDMKSFEELREKLNDLYNELN